MRESKNQGLEGIEKTSKIALKASYRTSTLKDAKITKKSSKNGPKTFSKRAPIGSKNSTYNLGTKFLTSEIGSKSNVKNKLKKTPQKTLPGNPPMEYPAKPGGPSLPKPHPISAMRGPEQNGSALKGASRHPPAPGRARSAMVYTPSRGLYILLSFCVPPN